MSLISEQKFTFIFFCIIGLRYKYASLVLAIDTDKKFHKAIGIKILGIKKIIENFEDLL